MHPIKALLQLHWDQLSLEHLADEALGKGDEATCAYYNHLAEGVERRASRLRRRTYVRRVR